MNQINDLEIQRAENLIRMALNRSYNGSNFAIHYNKSLREYVINFNGEKKLFDIKAFNDFNSYIWIESLIYNVDKELELTVGFKKGEE